MIRKSAVAVTAAAALALGTASATSLGTFGDVGFAASDVGLLDCEVLDGLIDLVPDLDATIAQLTTLSVDTFTLDTITVDIPTLCVGLDVDVVLYDAAGALLETLTGTTTETGITLDTLTAGAGAGLNSVTDIADIDEIRIVVRTVN